MTLGNGILADFYNKYANEPDRTYRKTYRITIYYRYYLLVKGNNVGDERR
jgi:hypothetical protein